MQNDLKRSPTFASSHRQRKAILKAQAIATMIWKHLDDSNFANPANQDAHEAAATGCQRLIVQDGPRRFVKSLTILIGC